MSVTVTARSFSKGIIHSVRGRKGSYSYVLPTLELEESSWVEFDFAVAMPVNVRDT